MLLSELFQRLSYGELSNLSLANGGNGTIVDAKKPALIYFANEVLTQLYSRFTLKESNLLLTLQSQTTFYILEPLYAESNTSPPTGVIPYIQDTPEQPFPGDVLRVLTVFDHCGVELPLNDANDCRSVFTPEPNKLQVPSPLDGATMAVSYQARHPKLTSGNETQQVNVPLYLEEALTAGIAYHVYSNMNGQENLVKAQEQDARYERLISLVEAKDLLLGSTGTTNTKLDLRGFA